MKKEWMIKTLTIGIVVLFIGTSFMPNINGDIGKISENQSPSVEIVNPREGYIHFSGIPLFPTIYPGLKVRKNYLICQLI